MAGASGRTKLLAAAVAALSVVALITWLAKRVAEKNQSAESTRVGVPAAAGDPASHPAEVVTAPASPAKNMAASVAGPSEGAPRVAERPESTPPAPVDFWLRLVDADSRATIAGIEVHVTPDTALPSNPGEPVRKEAREISDASGLVRIGYRTGWSTNARVEVDRYETGFCRIDDRHSEPSNAFSVHLHRSAALAIRFVGKRAAAMAAVVRVRNDGGVSGWTKSADREGICRVEGLPPRVALCVGASESGKGAYRLLTCDVVLAPGDHRALEFDLDQGAVVRGRAIHADGTEAARHAVALVRAQSRDIQPTRCLVREDVDLDFAQSTTTDDGGEFEMAGVDPGDWWIAVAREPEVPLFPPVLAQRLDVTQPDEDVEVLLRINEPPRIEGRVLLPSDNGAAYASVEAIGVIRDCVTYCRTDPQGSFVLHPLDDGMQRIRARGSTGTGDSDWVEVAPGSRDVVLCLTMSASIRGTVVDSTGVKVDRAYVTVIRQEDSEWPPSTDATPAFAVFGLSAGRYVLRATASDERVAISEPIALASGATIDGVALALELGATLEIVAPVREPATILVLDRDAVIAEPAVAIKSTLIVVPPRTLEVRAVRRGEVIARRIVSPHAQERLTVDLSGE